MKNWNRYDPGTKIPDGEYICTYGVGPYMGVLEYDEEKESFKTIVPGMEILAWRSASKDTYEIRTKRDAASRLWRDYEVEKPRKSGKYLCKYLHDYKKGKLRYKMGRGWNYKGVITHYMEI